MVLEVRRGTHRATGNVCAAGRELFGADMMWIWLVGVMGLALLSVGLVLIWHEFKGWND